MSSTLVGTGTYYLFELAPSGCSSSSASISVNYSNSPLVADASSYSILSNGKNVKLMGTATGGAGDYKFFWQELRQSSAEIIVTPWGTVTYNLLVTDSLGCTDIDSVTIDLGKPNCNCN